MSVWVMPSVLDVYENFLKRSQAVAGGRRRWAPPRMDIIIGVEMPDGSSNT